MRIFVTGASGFIGTAVTKELIAAGHTVIGLARSDASAAALKTLGAEVHRGDLIDLDSLQQGVAKSDGVIHLGFNHDFSKFMENCENDKRSITALANALQGSNRPLIITSGTGMGNTIPGEPAREDQFNPNHQNPRIGSEIAANAALERGVHIAIMRLPQVHNTEKQGLITYAIETVRQKKIAAYIGEGQNRWPAAHVLDVAKLYRLAIEKREAGARYHAVAEEGVTMHAMMEAISRGLQVPLKSITPDEAPAYFGWLSMFAGYDMPASSAHTRKALGWQPKGPSIIRDLNDMDYSQQIQIG